MLQVFGFGPVRYHPAPEAIHPPRHAVFYFLHSAITLTQKGTFVKIRAAHASMVHHGGKIHHCRPGVGYYCRPRG